MWRRALRRVFGLLYISVFYLLHCSAIRLLWMRYVNTCFVHRRCWSSDSAVVSFYRTTPRPYSTHFAVARRLSVRPYTPVLCQSGYMYPQTFSPLVRVRRVATPFWFLHTKRFGTIPTGTLLLGAPNEGVWKNCDFWPVSRFISKNNTR